MENNYMNLIVEFFKKYWVDYIISGYNKTYSKVLLGLIIFLTLTFSILIGIVTKSTLRIIGFIVTSVIFSAISFILAGFVIFILMEFPKYYLRKNISQIIARVDELFLPAFYTADYSKGNKVHELKRKINISNIPSPELLGIWIYKLKWYRQNLITIVPACSLIVYKGITIVFDFLENTNSRMLQHKSQIFITINNTIREMYISIYSPYLNYNKFFQFLFLVWILLIYQDEIQKANELVSKIELLKDLEKIKINKEALEEENMVG